MIIFSTAIPFNLDFYWNINATKNHPDAFVHQLHQDNMYDMLSEFRVSEFDSFVDILKLTPGDPLDTFGEMWYPVFLWSLCSSVFVHTCAGLVAFGTLRKHKYGKFFPVLLILMGVVTPVTSGVASSAAIAFIYRAAKLDMPPIHAMIWGVGQTVLGAGIGFTRILATL